MKNKNNQKTVVLMIGLIVILMAGWFAWGASIPQKQMVYTPLPGNSQYTPEEAIEPVPVQQATGAELNDIGYELPPGWVAEMHNEPNFRGLNITTKNDGGMIFIKVFPYTPEVGRREYYCNITNVCIPGTTYFEPAEIGNISGYIALAVDNSGSGPDYFGAKGDKFYIVSTYSPPNLDENGNYKENEFNRNFDEVMNSLEF